MKILKKLLNHLFGSRKYYVAILLNPLLFILNEKAGLDITPETLDRILYSTLGWIGIEGARDVAVAIKKTKPEAPVPPQSPG